MTPSAHRFLRVIGLCAIATAGSCSITPDVSPGARMMDGTYNHPILVEPSYRSLKVDFVPQMGGMTPQAAAQLDGFVADYRARGTGSIAVSVPASLEAQGMIDLFAGHINRMGIPRDRILVSTRDTPTGDMRVEVNYVSYKAALPRACGDWSEDLSFTLDNRMAPNFGCAVQQNLAANVADPRDLMSPRTMDLSSGARRTTIMGLYEQGKVTQAEKKTADAGVEQSAGASRVGD